MPVLTLVPFFAVADHRDQDPPVAYYPLLRTYPDPDPDPDPDRICISQMSSNHTQLNSTQRASMDAGVKHPNVHIYLVTSVYHVLQST